MKEIFFRTAIVLLATIGVLGVGRISIIHWTGEVSCPMIGSLPACYIIFIGYSLIVVSMYPRLQKASVLFLVGWAPLVILALTGVVGELTDVVQCPHFKNGIPQCYLSATLALTIGFLALLLFKFQTANADN